MARKLLQEYVKLGLKINPGKTKTFCIEYEAEMKDNVGRSEKLHKRM
jgi:hypothetical protein